MGKRLFTAETGVTPFIMAALLTLSGCAYVTTPEEKEAIRSDIDSAAAKTSSMEAEIKELKAELSALKKDTDALKEDAAKFRAGTAANTDALREDLSKTHGSIEEKGYDIKRTKENLELVASSLKSIDKRIDEKTKDIDAVAGRVASIEKLPLTMMSAEDKAELKASIEEVKKSLASLLASLDERIKRLEENAAKKEEAGGAPPPSALYNDGLDLVRKEKNYPKGLEVFNKFLSLYPSHELADNAQYWIGEIYYATEDFERAIVELNKVLKQYPDGDKVPAAMLKQAYAFEKLNSKKEAEVLLQRLIEKYPKSEEAENAKAKLKEIKK